MKKKLPIFAMLISMVALLSFSSCSDDEPQVVQKPPISEDLSLAFQHNEDLIQIASSIYTTEETENCTTFYFSPTADIHDIEGMEQASDFIKIVVADPSGTIDFSEPGNQILYQGIDLKASTMEQFSKCELRMRLTSHKTVAVVMDVETKSGETLKSDYYGLSAKWPKDEADEADYVCTEVYDAAYLGEVSSGSSNYYLVFTTAPYEVKDDGQNKFVVLTEPGYLLALDLFAAIENEDERLTLPEGVYEQSDYKEHLSYDIENTAAVYHDGAGSGRSNQVFGPVSIQKKGNVYTILASFYDENGMPMKIVYHGELTIKDVSSSGTGRLPSINKDTEIYATSARATYMGDVMKGASGMMKIDLMDDLYSNPETEGQGGLAASIVVFNKLFSNSKDAKLMEGVYFPARNFMYGSWLEGVEVEMQGFVLPFGSYIQKDDGTSMGQFLFGKRGSVVITELENDEYRVEFDMTSTIGRKMKGVYEGPIPVTDESEDDKKDDGTSTLEKDWDLDLNAITTARLFAKPNVFNDKDPQSDEYEEYACYRIDIGSRGGWDQDEVLKKGDIFSAELVVGLSDQGKIVPGVYRVPEENFPFYMKPGVARRGYFNQSSDWDGTSWMHFIPGEKDLYMKGHALAYGGMVRISRSVESADLYDIEIDVTCVRGMHIRGHWTGRIINGQTGEAVPCSANTIPEEELQPEAAAFTADLIRDHVWCIRSAADYRNAFNLKF